MPDLVDIEETRWSEARRRADLIRPLLRDGRLSREAAQWASRELGLSERQIYTLARRCREEAGALTAFVIEPPSGGRGRSRLTPAQDTVIRELIETMLPDKRRFANETIIREVRARCVREGIAPPSAATIRRRLKNAPAVMRRRRGEAVRCARPLVGETPPAAYPLAAVQMDHTLADIILVDPVERLPIGRPWLTVAIDIFSRCVAGFHIDLKSPSATTVGLCLTHIAGDKAAWLADRGIDAEWPLQGKPGWIGVDNAREFKSRAFQRGCDQHGIMIAYRPPGQPHYGGVVERVLGTMMGLVHEAPGTTRSNPQDRGTYDSQGKACLTLEEFEHFLGVAIAQRYHYALHHGLNEAPIDKLRCGLAARPPHTRPDNLHAYLIDFLPVCQRTLQRSGFVLDHIVYYSDAFQNWLREGRAGETFLIRRDPRDLSRIWVGTPGGDGYIEAPYRLLSRPPITLFEHRAALRRLRIAGCAKIDETRLFQAIEEMRRIAKEGEQKTLRARRHRERRRRASGGLAARSDIAPAQPCGDDINSGAEPYSEIELG